jgi:hypothetical protein
MEMIGGIAVAVVPVSGNRAQGLLVQDGSILEDLTALCVHHGKQRSVGNRRNKNPTSLARSGWEKQREGDAANNSGSAMQAVDSPMPAIRVSPSKASTQED